MADFFSAPETRLLAVLCSGRGADGTLGTQATNRSIPSGRFVRGAAHAPLRDPGYDIASLDRAVQLAVRSDLEAPALDNPEADPGHAWVRVEVATGYVYGSGNTGFVHVAAGTAETAAWAVLNPERRALADFRRQKRALECCDLVRDGTGETSLPPIIEAQLDGAGQWVDLGGGRGLWVATYRVIVEYNRSTVYDFA